MCKRQQWTNIQVKVLCKPNWIFSSRKFKFCVCGFHWFICHVCYAPNCNTDAKTCQTWNWKDVQSKMCEKVKRWHLSTRYFFRSNRLYLHISTHSHTCLSLFHMWFWISTCKEQNVAHEVTWNLLYIFTHVEKSIFKFLQLSFVLLTVSVYITLMALCAEVFRLIHNA